MTDHLTPEQRLSNVANYLLDATEIKRPHNGRFRGPTYIGTVNEIAPAARQLAEMVLKYINGELEEIELDGIPF